MSGTLFPGLPGRQVRKVVGARVDRLARALRFGSGKLRGVAYQLTGRAPAADVSDDILADRIRSSIGAVEKRLDVPRIHVMVQDHVALLHGAVATEDQVDELQHAVARVSGVVGVESYLHIGLGRGDTRPSDGARATHESGVLTRLLDAAEASGVPAIAAPAVVRAVLGTFAERLPEGERRHVAAHLPADVRELFRPPTRLHDLPLPHTLNELVARVSSATVELPPNQALDATRAVLRAFSTVVPEEAEDVTAVLPPELRPVWTGSDPRTATPRDDGSS